MIHEPKMIHNPSGEVVEVFSLGELVRFEPEESRMIEGNTAYQILTNQHTALQEVKVVPVIPAKPTVATPTVEDKTAGKKLTDLTYPELKTKAQDIGVFKHGISKKDLIAVLEKHGQS